jgi:hypothetical protein
MHSETTGYNGAPWRQINYRNMTRGIHCNNSNTGIIGASNTKLTKVRGGFIYTAKLQVQWGGSID